jgi:hypothetical protein
LLVSFTLGLATIAAAIVALAVDKLGAAPNLGQSMLNQALPKSTMRMIMRFILIHIQIVPHDQA